MVDPRRAAMRGATPALVAGIRAAIAALSAVAGGVLSPRWRSWRCRLRPPRGRRPPARVRATRRMLGARHGGADDHAVARRPTPALPGRYSLFTTATAGTQASAPILSRGRAHGDPQAARRTSATSSASRGRGVQRLVLRLCRSELDLPFTRGARSSSARAVPGVAVPAAEPGDALGHPGARPGGTTRAETLRAVPVFRDARLHLSRSSRTATTAMRPAAAHGRYALGETEWRDVDAAMASPADRGARRHRAHGLVDGRRDRAAGCSLKSAHRELVAGVVLESPVIDWRDVLELPGAAARGCPRPSVAARDRRARQPVGRDHHAGRRADRLRPPRLRRARGRAAASDPDPAQ